MFLACKEVGKSSFCFMGMMVCFGLLGYFMGAHYFSYVMIFFGLIGHIIMLSFELMLFEKEADLLESKDWRRRKVIVSGTLLSLIFLALFLIFRKNGGHFNSKIMDATMHKNILRVIREEHFVSVCLMMILTFASLVCINVIVKKEK